jgi:hypothetical protein
MWRPLGKFAADGEDSLAGYRRIGAAERQGTRSLLLYNRSANEWQKTIHIAHALRFVTRLRHVVLIPVKHSTFVLSITCPLSFYTMSLLFTLHNAVNDFVFRISPRIEAVLWLTMSRSPTKRQTPWTRYERLVSELLNEARKIRS